MATKSFLNGWGGCCWAEVSFESERRMEEPMVILWVPIGGNQVVWDAAEAIQRVRGRDEQMQGW